MKASDTPVYGRYDAPVAISPTVSFNQRPLNEDISDVAPVCTRYIVIDSSVHSMT